MPGQRATDAAPVTLGLWVDGKLTQTKQIETKPSGLVYFNPYSEERLRAPVPEGDHTLRLGFIGDPFVKTLAKEDIYNDKENKWIGSVTVIGPLASPGEKPSRKRILVCDPSFSPRCVDRILATLARRAYRRPVAGAEIADLRRFVELAKNDRQSIEEGIALAIQAMLVSPHFLFHIERDLNPTDPSTVHKVSDVEFGVEAELLPVEFDAGRGTAVAGRTPQVEHAAGARCAGDADAGRSEVLRHGREFRRAVARDSEPRHDQARSTEVPGMGP